jgi:anthranilate synthase component 1
MSALIPLTLYVNYTSGGGIVYDSDPYEEYVETLNKLKSNITTITSAEKLYTRLQSNENGASKRGEQEGLPSKPSGKAHIDLAAG